MMTDTEHTPEPDVNTSPDSERHAGGRPALELDAEQIQRLAELQCSIKEIAYIMGCHTDTIRRNFTEVVEAGKAHGKLRLRRAMFYNATEKNNPAVQIFLAKNLLGYGENGQNSDDDNILPWQD